MDNDPSAGDAVDIGVCLIVDEEVLHGIGPRIESGTVNVLTLLLKGCTDRVAYVSQDDH